MSVLDTLISNIDKTAYTSVWDMDKIIGTAAGSFVASAPPVGSLSTTTALHSTSFGDSYYFQGIYSIDNGVTWNDFGSMIPDLTTPGMPVFETLDVQGAVGGAGTMNIIAFNYYDNVHGTGTAKTILWKCIFFSKNQQGAINPEFIDDKTVFTSVDRNYQKVALKDQIAFDVSSGVGGTAIVTHNLGFVPTVRAFYRQTSPATRIDNLWAGYRIDTQISTTTVSFVLDANFSTNTVSGFIEYKIYYDS